MKKRTTQIIFRLTRDEADVLNKRAKKSGLSRESYLRHLLKNLVPTDLPPPDYYNMMRTLNAIGNTLDQIVQRAQAGGIVDTKRYDEAVVALDKAIIEITNAVMLPRKMN